MSGVLKKVFAFLAPASQKGDDGRDVWGSRASFVLASMGGAVGLGNLLRYPSIVYNNHGLQFFIPYLIAIFFLAIPTLLLEISIGQAYRGGCVLAWHHAHKRAKGVGFSVVYTGYAVCVYYVPIIAWIMCFFRQSFLSPLPYGDVDPEVFFQNEIVGWVDAEDGVLADDGSVERYTSYPGIGMVTEVTLWCFFTWFVVWICMYKGVGMLGRVVYFTMGVPLVLMVVLVGRACSLPNAVEGLRIYWTEWHGDKLAQGKIWQEAGGQVFFSTGIGMGYFTSYASYNAKYSNAVQDALIICICNSLIEVLGSMSVFGVVGYLGMHPDTSEELNTFVVGFLTYPEAIAHMPASNFWGVVFFATIFILGLSSAFALLETLVTLICDSELGKRYPRPYISTTVVVLSFLISLPFCTEFGYQLVDGADTWINYLALFWVVWSEAVCATSLYRYRDVIHQCGLPAFALAIFAYLGAMIIGLVVAHTVSAVAGAGVAFGLFVVFTVAAVFVSATPTAYAPRLFSGSPLLRRLFYLTLYSGHQLRRDLNATIVTGKQWPIPSFWAPVLKYCTAPLVSMVFSFAYPDFYAGPRIDPLHIAAFGFMHVVIFASIVGLVMPRWFDVLIPESKVHEGSHPVMPGVVFSRANTMGALDIEGVDPSGHDGVMASSANEAGADSEEKVVSKEK